jgi:hypothetical protein
MSFLPRIGAAAVLGAITMILAVPVAGAQTATFRSTPRSGPPGTTIHLTSQTACTLPAGVSGAPFIRASLSRGSTVITAATIALMPDGSWQGALTVGSQAAVGVDTIEVFCFASPQAEGVLLAYSPRTFTVTAGGLPETGFDRWTAGVAAVVLVVAGGGLMLAARRPRTGPAALDRRR